MKPSAYLCGCELVVRDICPEHCLPFEEPDTPCRCENFGQLYCQHHLAGYTFQEVIGGR